MPYIDEHLKKYLNGLPDSKLKTAMDYALVGGGKQIRPMLALSLLVSKGMDPTPYVDALLAVELVHTYSLIHDDLPSMDNDSLRRGKPTVHIAFDEATAILAGDALLTDSFNLIVQNKTLTDYQKVALVQILSKKSGSQGMVYGQIKDIESEQQSIMIEDLKLMYELKTSYLIQAALMSAAVICAPNEVKDYEALGYYIGLIFQIQDDILEYTLTPEETGKSRSDEIRNKPTYISLLGLEQARMILNDYTRELNNLIIKLNLSETKLHEQIRLLLTRKK